MKKILVILTICILLTGCSLIPRTKTVTGDRFNHNSSNIIRTDYGTFSIPDTWIKRDDHSTASKYFFANKNDKNKIPNNISVEMGTNKYSAEDHISFRQAILSQLSMQMKGVKATIKGDGTKTKQGYILYTFTIELDDSKNVTVQHYIVGDYKYVLVHETIWDGEREDTDNAAKTIVDSFVWKK